MPRHIPIAHRFPGPNVGPASATALVILAACVSACHDTSPAQPHTPTTAPAPQTKPALVAAAVPPAPAPAPPAPERTQADLRPHLTQLGLVPRAQGGRGTCSIFTTCEAIEFAIATQKHETVRLSPEYVNWAAGQAAGNPSDGNFFHNAVAGFERLGICTEELMPYQLHVRRGHSSLARRQRRSRPHP